MLSVIFYIKFISDKPSEKAVIMKTSLFILSFLLTSATAMAQNDDLITPDIEKALQKSNEDMINSVNEMNKTFEEVIPQITKSVEEMMGNFLNSITPVMEAIEKDQTLSKASKKLSQEFENSVKQIQQPDSLAVQGTKTGDGHRLGFNFSQNPDDISHTDSLIIQKSNPENTLNPEILSLNKQKLPLERFKLIIINNSSFLAYDDEEKQYTYLVGNLNSGANLQVEANGAGHKEKAREFAASVNAIPQAVQEPQLQAKENIPPRRISLYPSSR